MKSRRFRGLICHRRSHSIEPRQTGTPQGGVISPLLANLFLHYAFDMCLHYAFDMWMSRNYPQMSYCQTMCMGLSCGGAILAFSIHEFDASNDLGELI